jgi:hypothetical protein
MRGKTSIKDESIPLLSNKPSHYEEGLHEKIIVKLVLRIVHH